MDPVHMQTHSIIILTKDRPNLLPRAVASARAALRAGGEIVVVDDASNIPARDILAAFIAPDLRILRLDVSNGIGAARNAGIAASLGSVIFFLDDDDEIMPDYPATILAGPAAQFDYGFSNILTATADGAIQKGKPHFASGAISRRAPLRKQLCGTGMGFWINRPVALDIGPFSTEFVISEDIDYVCRLINQRRTAYYQSRPSMIIHRHDGAENLVNVTTRINSEYSARFALLMGTRYPALAAHFGRNYVRYCAKAGFHTDMANFIRQQTRLQTRLYFATYYAIKRVLYKLKSPFLRSA